MSDRPILFSSPMVRALLDGRKSMTRRVIKPRGHACIFDGIWTDGYVLDPGNQSWRERFYPWRTGDRLWVRESIDKMCEREDDEVCYMADWEGDPRGLGWRPSIFMPRWASRLTLIVTDVRVQRLRDISANDCYAEGVDDAPMEGQSYISSFGGRSVVNNYAKLWNSLNAARGYGWHENPWVIALSFTVERRNIDSIPRPEDAGK